MRRSLRAAKRITIILGIVCICAAAGCEDRGVDARTGGSPARDDAAGLAPAWQRAGGSYAVAADDPALHEALKAAIALAQESAPEARKEWLLASPAERDGWLIKWAAPLRGQRIDSDARDEQSAAKSDAESEATDITATAGGGGGATSESDSDTDTARAVEYVWVQPLEWSPFRIEGILLSEPREDIGWKHGDLVSFPIQELADWVYRLDGSMEGPRRGGFTVEALEAHFGPPPAGGEDPRR